MRTPATGSASPLEQRHVPVQVKLAAAWASFMLLYVYVDILSFYMPGVIDDIQAGKVWTFEITQTWAVGSLLLMAIPILMVVLSTALPARANRVTNLVVASVYVVVSAGNAVGESWTYFFGLAVALEVIVLAFIIRSAWTWPRTPRPTSLEHGRAKARQEAAL
jgi:hypothetical protein